VENFVFCAIRSRTPTSAGMLHVQLTDETMIDPRSWLNYAYWEMVHESFGLNRQQMKQMNQYLMDHLVSIAQENLLGQCTAGHSCKVRFRSIFLVSWRSPVAIPLPRSSHIVPMQDKAKRELQKLLATRHNASIVANQLSET
jgi:hypothetical protein